MTSKEVSLKWQFINLLGKANIKLNNYIHFLNISNVIEKCLAFGNATQRRMIIDEIISKDEKTSDSLLAMVKDKYGNYVVQKTIEAADMKTKELIIKRIINSQTLKKRDGFSKHVINFIEKMGFSPGALTSQIYSNNNNMNMNMNMNMNNNFNPHLMNQK